MRKATGLLALAVVALLLAACGGKTQFSMNNVTGHMPDLKLFGAKNPAGKVRSESDYNGEIVVLYFGYTHCPDVCPLTLSKLHTVLQKMGKQAGQVQVLFATVDPKRDTLAALHQYVQAFDPRLSALRATGTALEALTNRFHVSYSYGKPNASGDYPVNHSAGLFIFDGSGRLRLLGTSADSADHIAADLHKLIASDSSWW